MKFLPLIALLLLPMAAHAQMFKKPKDSNFSEAYPKENCLKPYKPSNFKSRSQQEDYANDVAHYKECVATYLKNATNDMKEIQLRANAAYKRSQEPF